MTESAHDSRSASRKNNKTESRLFLIGHGHRQRCQSTIDYIKTYGWVIIIMAVVLVAMWQRGFFNSSNPEARAQPGSCRVLRPQISGGAQISLTGVCSGHLPQFVAQFTGNDSYIAIPYYSTLYPKQYITVSLWFKTTEPISGNWIQLLNTAGFNKSCSNGAYCLRAGNSGIYFSVGTTGSLNRSVFIQNPELSGAQKINVGNWNNIVGVYDGSSTYIYWDGVLYILTPATGMLVQGANSIIIADPYAIAYQGSISNIQIYNTSLSGSEIKTLYSEGIGAPPMPTQNLVGWWPLNGDANDYSGNNNNGALHNVAMNSSWTSGYITPPAR